MRITGNYIVFIILGAYLIFWLLLFLASRYTPLSTQLIFQPKYVWLYLPFISWLFMVFPLILPPIPLGPIQLSFAWSRRRLFPFYDKMSERLGMTANNYGFPMGWLVNVIINIYDILTLGLAQLFATASVLGKLIAREGTEAERAKISPVAWVFTRLILGNVLFLATYITSPGYIFAPLLVRMETVFAPKQPAPEYQTGEVPTPQKAPPKAVSVKKMPSWAKIATVIGGVCLVAVIATLIVLARKPETGSPVTAQNAFGQSWLETSSLVNTRIAYCVVDGGIYLMNADGSGQTLVDSRGGESLAWSPDGSKIAYAGLGTSQDHFDLFVVNTDGSGKVQITTRGDNPAWSPDGKKIVYTSFENNTVGLYLMNVDGTRQVKLDDYGMTPSWSPDGSKIVYARASDGIWVMNSDGSGKTQLVKSGQSPAWSPDGSFIAYEYIGPDIYGIYIMNADGSGQRRLTSNKYGDAGPTWSPDSSMIAYMSGGKGWSINIVKVDGTKQAQITNRASSCWYPAWSPFLK